MSQSLSIPAPSPFSLAASVRFLETFTPAAYVPAADDALELAFPVEGTWAPAAARVRQTRSALSAELHGIADADAARDQVGRILSLDVDGSGFAAVGARDDVVGDLQARYPGLRPVLFWSPYEAAAWALIGHRIRIAQAAAIKARMAHEMGDAITIGTRTLHSFPAPERLLELDAFPGVVDRKVEWLRGIARAALEGSLDAALLRSMDAEEALAHLQGLPGIGPFSAELVLLRGAGAPDIAPRHEARFLQAVQRAYGLEAPPTAEQLTRLTDGWRPYRTWVTVLLRAWLEDDGRVAR